VQHRRVRVVPSPMALGVMDGVLAFHRANMHWRMGTVNAASCPIAALRHYVQ